MAELVPLDRSGDWRRRLREQEEVAVGFRAARPDHNAGLNWRGNRNVPTLRTVSDMDLDLIVKLEKSGRVNINELLTWHTSHHLVHQGERIDRPNNNIISYINEMARGRRMLLHLALKEKSKTAEAKRYIIKFLQHGLRTYRSFRGKSPMPGFAMSSLVMLGSHPFL